MGPLEDRNPDATIYVGSLEPRVTEELLWELFLQCAPVLSVHFPRDRVTNEHGGFGFVEFRNETDAEYAIRIMNNVRLFGRAIRANKASAELGGGMGPGQ